MLSLLVLLVVVQSSFSRRGVLPILTGIGEEESWSPGVDCFSSRSIKKETFPNIDFAFYGYNIFKSFPLTYGRDPGYTHKMFDAVYGDRSFFRQSSDCRFMQPLGWDWVQAVTCSTSFSSTKVENEEQFKTMLSASVSGGGGYGPVSFSASVGYNQAKEKMEKAETTSIYSEASCDYYYGVLDPRNPPPLTREVKQWLLDILGMLGSGRQTHFVEKEVYEFVATYGTHIITEMKLGSKFIYERTLQKKEVTDMESSGVDVSVSASYGSAASFGASMSSSQENNSRHMEEKSNTKTVSIGSAPPANGDAMQWASSIKDTPMPVFIDTKPITKILHSKFLGKDHIGHLDQLNIIFKGQIVQLCKDLNIVGVGSYCDNILTN